METAVEKCGGRHSCDGVGGLDTREPRRGFMNSTDTLANFSSELGFHTGNVNNLYTQKVRLSKFYTESALLRCVNT
jgi:hypothetical protein